MKAPYRSRHFDKAGMAVSFLCLIHCLALPLIYSLLPWCSNLGHSEGVHEAFAMLVLPVGLLALGSGYRHHRQSWILLWGMAGLLCIATAVLACEQLGETVEHRLSILGSIQLVLAHYFNLRNQRCCPAPHVH